MESGGRGFALAACMPFTIASPIWNICVKGPEDQTNRHLGYVNVYYAAFARICCQEVFILSPCETATDRPQHQRSPTSIERLCTKINRVINIMEKNAVIVSHSEVLPIPNRLTHYAAGRWVAGGFNERHYAPPSRLHGYNS